LTGIAFVPEHNSFLFSARPVRQASIRITMIATEGLKRTLPGRVTALPPIVRYALAVAAAAAAILFRLEVDPIWGTRLPYITLFPAIMVSAWLGGLGPGIVTTVISATAAAYFWVEPSRTWAIADKSELLGLFVFVAVGVVISALNEAWRRGTTSILESEERLAVTLRSIGDGVITTDHHGHITRINPVAEALTGWAEAEAIGRPLQQIFAIIDAQTRRPAENPVERVLRDGMVRELANHTVLAGKHGREIPIDDSAAPIRTGDGTIVGAVMVFRDISERRQAERERTERERVSRELAAIVESSEDAILRMKLDGTITAWNRAAERMYGYQAIEVIGRSIHVIVPEQRRPEADSVLERIRAGDRVETFETVRRRQDGTEFPVSLTISPVRDSTGAVIGASKSARDITERKRADERFRLAVEAAPAAMLLVDSHGTIVMINALTERLLGYTSDELVGQPVEQLVPSRFRSTHMAFRRGFFSDARQRPMGAGRDLFALRKDGSEVPVVIGLSPIETPDGRFVIAAVTDITERKQGEAERMGLLAREQAARVELERAGRVKDEFLAVLSHELRTPLNAILGYAHLLSSGAVPPARVSHAVDAIERNAQAQARLIESLLDLSRIIAGKFELEVERVNVSTIVEAAVDVIRPEAASKGIALDIDLPPVAMVTGDGGRLQQVFWNLLANAIKFTERGGRVSVRLEARASDVRVQVSDNGRGIAADFLPHVFDRFTQAENRARRSPSGLGLGLALVREMVQAHGGTVVAESAGEGRGTVFTVALPMATSTASGIATKEPAGRAGKLHETLPPLQILIVDDEQDAREFLAFLLESRGARVATASAAAEAFDAISRNPPDVLLADLRMPEEDGLSLIRRVRAREGHRHDRRLPAVAVTAYASVREREQAIDAGYDAHIAKPIDPEELIRAIARATKTEPV
jgi:PAS domain S-box-containing protein